MIFAFNFIAALFLGAAFFSSSAIAFPLNDSEKIEMISQDRLWLRLLHLYAPGTEVISGGFYLTRPEVRAHSLLKKKIDSKKELFANLEMALSDVQFQCRFPARDEFLRQSFSEHLFPPKKNCQVFEAWRARYEIDSISIVYPSNSLKSSLSVFSHTFLKLNSAKLPRYSSLNLALGFAAELDPQDSFLKMASMGILGGYVGQFALTNYYTEINRYGEAESRDIFEYHLNFSKQEIEFMLKHVWELQEAEFNYYFLNGNCSYHLLTVLEIGRPQLELSSKFNLVTIPITSLKVVIQEEGLLSGISWIPGRLTRKDQMLESLSLPAREFFVEWSSRMNSSSIDNKSFFESLERASLQESDKATVLDLMGEALRGRQDLEKFRSEVLTLRSQLPPEREFTAIELPKEQPHISHGAQALSAGFIYNGLSSEGGGTLRYRPAFHDLLDPKMGFFKNTSFEIADIRLRYTGKESFKDSDLTLIHAFALNPQSEDQSSPTWLLRSQLQNFLETPVWKNNLGLGIGKNLGSWSPYVLAQVDSLMDAQEEKGLGVFAGVAAGLLFDPAESIKLSAKLNYLWPLQSRDSRGEWSGGIGVSYTLSTQRSLQMTLENGKEKKSALGEFVYYF